MYPNEILILGHRYDLVSDASKNCKAALATKDSSGKKDFLKGCILTNTTQKIFIDPTLHIDEWHKTLIHEILHGIIHHMGIVFGDEEEEEAALQFEEKLVEMLSIGLFSVIKENFKLDGRTGTKKRKQRGSRNGKRGHLAITTS